MFHPIPNSIIRGRGSQNEPYHRAELAVMTLQATKSCLSRPQPGLAEGPQVRRSDGYPHVEREGVARRSTYRVCAG
jgi:hypothetical protein